MKRIESSKLVTLASPVEDSAVKYSLVERLRGAFHVETVGDGSGKFSVTMAGKESPYHCALNVIIKTDGQRARLIIDGITEINSSTKIFYALGVLALLVLGLFPGTISTNGHGNAMDFMVFLFLGVFVVHDINKKLAEPGILLDRVLQAIETEFGA